MAVKPNKFKRTHIVKYLVCWGCFIQNIKLLNISTNQVVKTAKYIKQLYNEHNESLQTLSNDIINSIRILDIWTHIPRISSHILIKFIAIYETNDIIRPMLAIIYIVFFNLVLTNNPIILMFIASITDVYCFNYRCSLLQLSIFITLMTDVYGYNERCLLLQWPMFAITMWMEIMGIYYWYSSSRGRCLLGCGIRINDLKTSLLNKRVKNIITK